MISYFSSGCLGDAIYSLPSVRSHGKGNYYFGNRPWTRPIEDRLWSLKRLFESQDCIGSVEVHRGQPITVDFSTFRNGGRIFGDTIIDRQARWTRANIDLSKPWIQADPDPRTKGRIVVNRSPRWNGFWMPWKALVEAFGPDMLFIGLDDEYGDFCAKYGHVERLPIKDLMDAAQAIAGAEMYMGNQSSCNAIAEGLHKFKLTEVCLYAPDCLYKRQGALYYVDGQLSFTALGKEFSSGPDRKISIPRNQTPPGGWRADISGKTYSSYAFDSLVNEIQRVEGMDKAEAESLIEAQAMQRLSAFNKEVSEQNALVRRVNEVMRKKGI